MKKIIGMLIVLIVAGLLFGCTQTQEDTLPINTNNENNLEEVIVPQTISGQYVDLTPAQAKKLIEIEEDLVVLDVSPNWEFGRLPGAINYYIGDGSLDMAIPTLDKSKVYLVYCHVDAASIPGAQKLVAAGFEKVYRLEGNYAAWVDAGYAIEK